MSMTLDKRCDMCGAQIDITDDGRKGLCPYCGARYSYVKSVTAASASALNRANNYRLKNMFDNAVVEFQTLLRDENFADNPEVYWGLLLAEFGIEYVHDTREDVYIPTCHRTVSRSVFNDPNYIKARELADANMRETYERLAAEIDALQRDIKAQAALIEDYEVFICFKSADKKAATEDRYIARKIFDELTKRGFRTFFSEVSLKGRIGSEYEPLIYKALTTARVMILVATKEEYLNAPFVRNEWSRFAERKKEDASLSLVPVFRDLDFSLLSTKEQGIDLEKYPAGGYEIDIADNLETRLGKRAVPKIDREVIEEYSRYNEVNKIKFEKEYNHALRDVDITRKRTKNAGAEYAAKCDEMERLGDYRNAAVLTAEYGKKAEYYSVAEKKLDNKFIRRNLLVLAELAVILVLAIVFTFVAATYKSDFIRQPTSLDDWATIFMNGGIVTFVGIGLQLFTAIIYALLSKISRYSKMAKTIETVVFLLAIPFIIAPLVIYALDLNGFFIVFYILVLAAVVGNSVSVIRKNGAVSELTPLAASKLS